MHTNNMAWRKIFLKNVCLRTKFVLRFEKKTIVGIFLNRLFFNRIKHPQKLIFFFFNPFLKLDETCVTSVLQFSIHLMYGIL